MRPPLANARLARARVAAIDSAARSGFAILESSADGPLLLHHGSRTIDGPDAVTALVGEVAAYRPELVAIEAPYIAVGRAGANVHTGLELAVLLGRWRQAFEMTGIQTTAVLASTWQVGLLGCDRRAKREERKRLARAYALTTFGAVLDEDTADAVALAAWLLRQRSREKAA